MTASHQPLTIAPRRAPSAWLCQMITQRPGAVVVWTIVIGAVFRFALAAAEIDLDHSEAYYIGNARQPEFGYFDHPPLAHWLIWIAMKLTGSSALPVVRAPFILMFAGTTWLMFRLGETLYDRETGAIAALLLNFSLLFTISFGAWAQPDGPLTFFLTAAMLGVSRLEQIPDRSARLRLWLLVGLCFGLALLAKYAAVAVALGLLVFALTSRPHWHWFAEPGPYLGAALASLLFTPVILWNSRHGWISFAFQGGRAAEVQGLHLRDFFASVGGQSILLGPWIWAVCLGAATWGLWRGPRDARTWLPAVVGTTPILLFTATELWSPSGGHFHWQAPGYLVLLPLLAHLTALELRRGNTVTRGWLFGSGVTTAVVIIALALNCITGWGWRLLPASFAATHTDPTLKGAPWHALRTTFNALDLTRQRRLFVAVTSRAEWAKIDFELGDALPVLCLCADARSIAFTRDASAYLGWNAVIISKEDNAGSVPAAYAAYFSSVAPLDTLAVSRGDQIAARLSLFYGTDYLKPYPVTP